MHTKANRRGFPQNGPAGRRETSLLVREPLFLLAFLITVFYFGRPLLIPLALALTLNFLFAPLVARLERRRLGRGPAVLLVMVGVTLVLSAIVWLVAVQLLRVVNDLGSHAPNIHAKLAATHVPPSSPFGQAVTSIEGLSREFSADPAQQGAQQLSLQTRATTRARNATRRAKAAQDAGAESPPTPVVVVQAPASTLAYLRQILRPIAGPLGTAGMVLIFTVYLLLKREDLRNRLLLLAGIGRLNLVSQALDDAANRISRYLTANVSVNAGYGAVFGATLYAIGIPYAVLWGTLLAILRTVPYIGPVIGGGAPALFALVYFPGWWQAGCTVAFVALLEILVSNFLEPRLYGAHTGISELAMLAMAIIWTLLWGWPGLALSTPLTACLVVAGRTLPQLSFLHILLGDDAELAPEARFYERLLSTDSAEAHLIADRFLAPAKEPGARARTPLDLYDTVLLPALALAENDRHKGLLDEQQASFFMQNLAELIAELTTSIAHSPMGSSSQPARARYPVVCVPSADEADEIAASMLAQLLESAGHKTLFLPSIALTPELLGRFAQDPTTTLCLSALPPLAFAGTRALYTQLRASLPFNPILIGLWRSATPPELLRARFGMQASSDRVVTTLAAALQSIREGEPARSNIPAATAPTREPVLAGV